MIVIARRSQQAVHAGGNDSLLPRRAFWLNFKFTANIFLCCGVIIVFLMAVDTRRIVASSTIDGNVQLKMSFHNSMQNGC